MGLFSRWFRSPPRDPLSFETVAPSRPIIEDIYRLHPYEWEYVVPPSDHIYSYLYGTAGLLQGSPPAPNGIVKISYRQSGYEEIMEWNPRFHTYRASTSVSTILRFFARPPRPE